MLSPGLGALRMESPMGLTVNLLLLVSISSPTKYLRKKYVRKEHYKRRKDARKEIFIDSWFSSLVT